MKKHILECLNKKNEVVYHDIYEIESKDSFDYYDKFKGNVIKINNKAYVLYNNEEDFNYDVVIEDWKKAIWKMIKTENMKTFVTFSIIPIINIWLSIFLMKYNYKNRSNFIKKDIFFLLMCLAIVFVSQISNVILNNENMLVFVIYSIISSFFMIFLELLYNIKNKSYCNNLKILKLKDFVINDIYNNDSEQYMQILKKRKEKESEKVKKKESNKLDNLLNNLEMPKHTYLKVDNVDDNILNEIDFKIKEKNTLNISKSQ